MSRPQPNAIQKNPLQVLIKNTHEKDPSGALILRYGKSIYYLMLVSLIIIILGLVSSPPKEVEDLLIALLLLCATVYYCITSKNYRLLFIDHIILRDSPWPWHKNDLFDIHEITEIDVNFRALRVNVKMKDNRELPISFMLNSAFWLLNLISKQPNIKISERERKIIEHYSQY